MLLDFYSRTLKKLVDGEYDVTLKGDDMRQAETIEELFNIVKGKYGTI